MKFTLVKDLGEDALMRPLLGGMLLFLLLFLIIDVFNAAYSVGLSMQTIQATLFGDEASFVDPLPETSLLEMVHMQTFFTMMALITLSAVFGRLCRNDGLKMLLINTVMLFAIVALLSLPAAFYLSGTFILSYMIAFWIWHLSALFMTLTSLWRLLR